MSGKQQRNMCTAEPLVSQPEPLMCMADDQDLMGNEAIQAQMSQQSSDSGMSMLDAVPFMIDPLKEALSAGRFSGNDPTAMGMGAQAGDALGVLGAGLGVVSNLDKALNADSAAEAAVAGLGLGGHSAQLIGGMQNVANGNYMFGPSGAVGPGTQLAKAGGQVAGAAQILTSSVEAYNADSALDAAGAGIGIGTGIAGVMGSSAAAPLTAGALAFKGTTALLDETVGKKDNMAKTVDESEMYKDHLPIDLTVDGYDPDSMASKLNAWATPDVWHTEDAEEAAAEHDKWYMQPGHWINSMVDD